MIKEELKKKLSEAFKFSEEQGRKQTRSILFFTVIFTALSLIACYFANDNFEFIILIGLPFYFLAFQLSEIYKSQIKHMLWHAEILDEQLNSLMNIEGKSGSD